MIFSGFHTDLQGSQMHIIRFVFFTFLHVFLPTNTSASQGQNLSYFEKLWKVAALSLQEYFWYIFHLAKFSDWRCDKVEEVQPTKTFSFKFVLKKFPRSSSAQIEKMTGETPEVRSDKRKLREDRQNHVDIMDLIDIMDFP